MVRIVSLDNNPNKNITICRFLHSRKLYSCTKLNELISAGNKNFWPKFGPQSHSMMVFRPKFWQNGRNFWPLAKSKVKNLEKSFQSGIFENFANSQNSSIWPIFGGRPKNVYFFGRKKILDKTANISVL